MRDFHDDVEDLDIPHPTDNDPALIDWPVVWFWFAMIVLSVLAWTWIIRGLLKLAVRWFA